MSLYFPLGVIPKLIKVRLKGKSLIRVIGPRRLPITRWVGIVQDRRIPFMGSCEVHSRVPLQIFIHGSSKDREIHEATSASQWHSIAINGADPLFSTNFDRPIIYRVFEPLNLSRGMDGVSLSIACIFIHNQINYAMVSCY